MEKEMRREMTEAEQAEAVSLTREIILLLADKKPQPAVAYSALVQVLLEVIKHLDEIPKDNLQVAADIIETLQHAMKTSTN